LEDLLNAIERRDDEWIRKNYGAVNGVGILPLTSAWFLEHFSLRSNMEVLPGLNLPIYIFHGTLDQNVDVLVGVTGLEPAASWSRIGLEALFYVFIVLIYLFYL